MIHELSESEYLRTFSEPMRRLTVHEDPPVQLSLKDYVGEAIRVLKLPTTAAAIELQHEYLGNNQRFTHVIFNYGFKNRFLVVVVDNIARAVLGHRLLELDT